MANRLFNQFRLALEKQVVDLYMEAAIGASGAPTLNVQNSKGIASITRNSAGKYTIVLQDSYQRMLMCMKSVSNVSGIEAAPDMGVLDSTDIPNKSLVIQLSAAGVATDPASGDTLKLQISLSNSTAR